MSSRLKRTTLGAVAVVAIAVGGAAIGNAATSQSAATTTTTVANSSPSVGSQVPAFPAHGTSAHEDAEKAVSGDAATKAKAAAVKAVGSGTAGAVTTDFTGNGYEVTVTKSDGSTAEIHLDSSFNVQQGPGGFGH
jgi:cytoskeletal protein RodZ